ncbi:protein phosphatase regulator [Zalerion maritima]|uniref:Protein phosphatase regulator n=1 Tax=Zalerion maritima TaxID=339359 RepID=A0AAD5WQW0_9PEZI|nr:protein phosphatase regulator [Zalerion maritima]
MPYTPPSARSPASSPEASRRPSLQTTSRPSLPRSASYLTRQPRRTNSWSEKSPEQTATDNALLNAYHPPSTPPNIMSQTTPPGTSEDLQSLISGVVRQSPPPVTDGRSMPKGAIISPPDSSNSSSDEAEEPERGRTLEKQMVALQEAISQIPQHRSMSPPRTGLIDMPLSPPSTTALSSEGMHHCFSTGSLLGLGGGNRRRSHVKSNTEPKIIYSKSLDASLTESEEDSDVDIRKKPVMVRKKSGELVRPALRPSSRKRPSSMPGTPTFGKNVHFDSCLEQVRHFCDVDRPSAVSAGSSPVDTYDTDDEFPFEASKRSPPCEWELVLSNFPGLTESRKSSSVRMERVWLSADQKSLLGSVIVSNLAFQKIVTCRFTLDYWKTTSEVAAEYSHEVRPRESPIGQDRFTFSIKLADTANLENKTLYFCIRYNVNGQELWDNNNHANFQVDFKKKHLPQNGKRGFQGASFRLANSLPRSNRRGTPPSSRKGSNSGTLDDFRQDGKADRESIHEVLGEAGSTSGLRLKGVKSTPSIASDNLSKGLGSPSGQAFSNRYDFGASLSAAKQAAKGSSPMNSPTIEREVEGLYMKPNRRGEAANAAKMRMNASTTTPTKPSVPQKPSAPNSVVPAPYASAIASSSYEEILNKYCFFGSKQGSPEMKDGMDVFQGSDSQRSHPSKDKIGADSSRDASGSRSTSSTNSSSNNSPECHHEPTAQHHSLFPVGSGQYVYGGPLAMSSSPLHTPTGQPGSRSSSPVSLGNGFAPLTVTTIRG